MDRIRDYIDEDVGEGDITTRSLGIEDMPVLARIVAEEPCTLAGGAEALEVFQRMGTDATLKSVDGEKISTGDLILEARGTAGSVLVAERLALNLLSRMSGIATATRELTDKVQAINSKTMIAATRKTTPGFRVYEKKAVELGGGDPHRQRLDDLVLIKDNHLSVIGDVKKAVELARKNSSVGVEVEVESMEHALEAVEASPDIIMLDNMSPEQAKNCYDAIKERAPGIMVEVSGGITPENAPLYANCADRISMSRITSYARPIDFTLHFYGE